MMTTTLALIMAAAALIVAYLAIRQAGATERRLTEIGGTLRQLQAAVNDASAKTEAKLTEMHREKLRATGAAAFAPAMTIKDAMAVDPRVEEVLARFQLGGCSQCAVSDGDTIEGACQSYGIDQKALMTALNQLLEGDGGGPSPVARGAKPIDVAKGRLSF